MNKVTIIGGGAWGTALAIQAARAGADVTLWARDPARLGPNHPRLAGVILPDGVRVTDTFPANGSPVILAVPTQQLARVLDALRPSGLLLLCCKGLEIGTERLPVEIAADLLPGNRAGVLTGPNFAAEIAAGLPAAAVLASASAELRSVFISLLATPSFRLYGSDDVVGAQLGGAAKNVIAIAAGAAIGGGFGENARAALITRGLAEMSRLVAALGGRADTATGLSGLGDLVLTCTGTRSRNFTAGVALGRDGRLPDDGALVEGVATATALVARGAGVDMPICTAVADVLAGRCDVRGALSALLARALPAGETLGAARRAPF